MGIDEAKRSLIGKVFGEKRTNFIGMRNIKMKLWYHRVLCKVISLDLNVYQFVFNSAEEREGILQGRLWFFDNQVMVLHLWTEV